MKRRAYVRNTVLAGLGMLSVGAIASVVYAHCGVCAGSCKEMVAAMDTGKTDLGKAITTAQDSCKGKAVKAMCHLEDKKLEYQVYCLVGDKIKLVELDNMGKVTETADVKDIKDEGGHDEKLEHKEKK